MSRPERLTTRGVAREVLGIEGAYVIEPRPQPGEVPSAAVDGLPVVMLIRRCLEPLGGGVRSA